MRVYFLFTNFLLCGCLLIVLPSPTLNPRLAQLATEMSERPQRKIIKAQQHYPALSKTMASALQQSSSSNHPCPNVSIFISLGTRSFTCVPFASCFVCHIKCMFISTNFLLCSCLLVVLPSPTLNPRLAQLAKEVSETTRHTRC